MTGDVEDFVAGRGRREGGPAPVEVVVPFPELEGLEGGALELALARRYRNDMGNAERLRVRAGRDFRYVGGVGWLAWTGRKWSREEGGTRLQLATHETAVRIWDEARALEGAGARKDEARVDFLDRVAGHRKWAAQCGNSQRLASMGREAAPYLTVAVDHLDTEPLLFNAANGTLELGAAGGVETREHRREDLITQASPVAYEPEAEAPTWRAFLERALPDRAVQAFIQRYAGYSLTGDISEQSLVLCYGRGANGKSTLLEVLSHILGDYAKATPFASLLHDDRRRGSEASPDLARLLGARLVTAAEPEVGARFSEAMLKSLTGGERIPARHLREEFFEFSPKFKLWLSFNNRPSVRGQDEGIWRRLLLVPFDVVIPRPERDRRLVAKLKAEASGILNWALDGYRLWAESGLAVPEAVRAATDEYRLDSDPVGQFLQAAVGELKGGAVRARVLYSAYAKWCRENAVKPFSETAFGTIVPERGIRKEKAGAIFYRDIELKPGYEAPDDGGQEGGAD